jgi:hypothetical protein
MNPFFIATSWLLPLAATHHLYSVELKQANEVFGNGRLLLLSWKQQVQIDATLSKHVPSTAPFSSPSFSVVYNEHHSWLSNHFPVGLTMVSTHVDSGMM